MIDIDIDIDIPEDMWKYLMLTSACYLVARLRVGLGFHRLGLDVVSCWLVVM